eukprot:TRINITY_DN13053_c0_g1_i2.p1 TRINITY_DN13053_c0_g1~~TRINITY_DN13053_c0_g1_i2.p1  ORF type:complete len:586 (-),score=99.46 TRINITY_DN13053_c0_g1_i2:614-2281(-)
MFPSSPVSVAFRRYSTQTAPPNVVYDRKVPKSQTAYSLFDMALWLLGGITLGAGIGYIGYARVNLDKHAKLERYTPIKITSTPISDDSLLKSVIDEEDQKEQAILAAGGTMVGHIARRQSKGRLILRILQLGVLFMPILITTPIVTLVTRVTGSNKGSGSMIGTVVEDLWWAMVQHVLQLAGPCWVKFGQWAATRPDLFPPSFIDHLSTLHSHVHPHSVHATDRAIRNSFGNTIEELFLSFEPYALASGAIAQVHRAVTQDGQVVVVKVLHPHVLESIMLDLSIMYIGARVVNALPGMRWLSLPDSLEDFGRSMLLQADLRREALNLVKFGKNFAQSSQIAVPRAVYPLISRQVLVETFEPGVSIERFLERSHPLNKQLAKLGLDAYMKMMLVDNFIHSDLHPGNVLVRTPVDDFTGETMPPQLVLLDVGLVTELSEKDRKNFHALFGAVVRGDGRYGAMLMIKHAREKQCTPEEQEKFKSAMGQLFAEVGAKKLSDVDVGALLGNILSLVRTYRIKIESNFATLVMGTVVLEGLGRQLDPDLNLLTAAVPFLVR